MIQIINTDTDRITSDSLCKAQEDYDLISDFALQMRVQRELNALLDDEPVSVLVMEY